MVMTPPWAVRVGLHSRWKHQYTAFRMTLAPDSKHRSQTLPGCVWPLLIILFAFAFRVAYVQAVPYDYDRAYSPGIGLSILSQLRHGPSLVGMLHSESSNSGLTNPALANYLFALIAAFDPSPYVATLLTAMIGVMVPVFTYGIGRTLFGVRTALIALVIACSNPWSGFFSRGAWYTGYFELAIVVTIWFLVRALSTHGPVSASAPIVASAVLAHFYLVAFGMAAQLALGLWIIRARLQSRSKTTAAFVAAWVLSVAVLGAVVAVNRASNIRTTGFELVYGNPTEEQKQAQAKPYLNLFTVERLSDLIGGHIDETTPLWLFRIYPTGVSAEVRAARPSWSGAWLIASRWRAIVINLAALTGFIMWMVRSRKHSTLRVLLMWALMPVVGQIVITSLLPTFPANHQNMYLASPMIYLMPALGLTQLTSAASKIVDRLALLALALVGCLAIMVIPFMGWAGEANMQLHPLHTPAITDMSLLWQTQLSTELRANCARVNSPENPFELSRLRQQYWFNSLMQNADRVRANADVHANISDGWQVRGDDGDCAVRLQGESAPPYSERLPMLSPDLSGRVSIFRSVANLLNNDDTGTINNLGWHLLATDLPTKVTPGEVLTVQQRWRIDQPNADVPADARYDTFVRLISPNGRTVAQADASAVRAEAWVIGEQLQTATRLIVPQDLQPGSYQIDIAHYDRSQKKNAVFIKPGLAAPVVNLTYAVQIDRVP